MIETPRVRGDRHHNHPGRRGDWDPTERPEGYALETIWGDSWSRIVGRIRLFQPEVAEALHLAEALSRSPSSLAYLFEAIGPTALKLTGEILAHRLGLREGTGDD